MLCLNVSLVLIRDICPCESYSGLLMGSVVEVICSPRMFAMCLRLGSPNVTFCSATNKYFLTCVVFIRDLIEYKYNQAAGKVA